MAKLPHPPSRLAAGPSGPRSLRALRSKAKLRSASAILSVCLNLIDRGVRPTFAAVRDNAKGFSEATLNRKRNRPIVHAAQARFDRKTSNTAVESSGPDTLEQIATAIKDGTWADDKDAQLTTATNGAMIESDSSVQSHPQDQSSRLSHLEAEIARRDAQLLNALSVAHKRAATIKRRDIMIAELRAEVAALSSVPFPPREKRDWGE
jgi:hypothetical protein